MGKHKLAFVAFDSAKEKHAVAIADDGRDGEVRYLGEIENSPDAVRKLVTKLSRRYERLHFCYEAGPTGYGLHRQLTDLGHVCDVIAPTMIPKRCGDRVKTNRRDSVTLVKLLRAGELRAIWVPDTVHEAVRDLTRAREAAMIDLKKKRQQLLSFLLQLQEAENQIIVDYEVYGQRPNDCDLLVPAIDTHQALLGRAPHLAAADAAFYSAKNEAAAKAKGVKRVCIPNRSTKSPERKREQKKR